MTIAEQWADDEPAQAGAAVMMESWGFTEGQTSEARARVLGLVEPEPCVMLAACDMVEAYLDVPVSTGMQLSRIGVPDEQTVRLAEAVANYVIALSSAKQGVVENLRPVSILGKVDRHG